MNNIEAIVIGTSAGGFNALKFIFENLPENFPYPILVVQHIHPYGDGFWISLLNSCSKINIKEAEEKEKIIKGNVYIAPNDYHILIEPDFRITLSVEEKVNYSRPSIDILFETAAEAYKNKLMGIILTGTNNDGAFGLKKIKEKGGLTIVEDPTFAEFKTMPEEAIKASRVDYILTLAEILNLLINNIP